MGFTIFYSWEYDLPKKYNREFIHNAIELAIGRIGEDTQLEDAPRLDHDTLGIAGSPEIAATILRKIETCGVFVADLSFVGGTTTEDPNKPNKLLPNPNVLLELGYAAGKIGWDRIILVINEHYGKANELMFDLKHRRFPIMYKINNERKNRAGEIQQQLSEDIEAAVRQAIRSEHEAVGDAIASLDIHCLQWMKSLGEHDYFHAPIREMQGDILINQRLDAALPRLIDLKLLKCDVNQRVELYAYHWTYLGKLVLVKLGLRKRKGLMAPAYDPFTYTVITEVIRPD